MTEAAMQIHIFPGSELPIYRQIMQQITDAIASGLLRPGDQLTSQRELAEQLVISPLTVKKAYDELEREGVIHTQRGRGTFVTTELPEVASAQQLRRLRGAARQLLTRAHLSGLSLGQLVGLLEEVEAELDAQRAQRSQRPEETP